MSSGLPSDQNVSEDANYSSVRNVRIHFLPASTNGHKSKTNKFFENEKSNFMPGGETAALSVKYCKFAANTPGK